MEGNLQNDAATHARPGHVPVLLEEVLQLVGDVRPLRILDCCFGGGGHSGAFLERTGATVVAVDRDPDAVVRATALKARFGDRFEIHHCNYSEVDTLSLPAQDVVFFDLGISSYHVDEAARGFSFNKDAPLDMRMDPTRGMSAAEFLEKAPMDDVVRAVREYGEEKNWKKVVTAIEDARGTGILSRTVSLARLIESVTPSRQRRMSKGMHPATQTFQGLRIAVNEELNHLRLALPKAFQLLREGGRMLVIAFHSLEDRIVKRQFRSWAGFAEDASDSMARQDRVIVADRVTRKPIRPSADEIAQNPRSRSAVLRVIDKRDQRGEVAA